MVCNLSDALIVIKELEDKLEDVNSEVEKCYAEIADKEWIIKDLFENKGVESPF